MRFILWVLLGWLLPLLASAADSQRWQPVFGHAVSMGGTAETVYAVGKDGAVWQWQQEGGFWGRLPGELKGIKTSPNANKLWGIATDGEVLRYTGIAWEPLGIKALDMAVSQQGELFWVRLDGTLRKRNLSSKDEADLPGQARQIAIGKDGTLWARLDSGELAQFNGSAWMPVEGKASHLGVDADGEVVITSIQGEYQRWNSYGKAWSTVSTPPGVSLAVKAFNNTVWVSLANGAMVAQGTLTKNRIQVEGAANGSITINRRGNSRGGSRGRRMTAGAAYVAVTPSATVTDTSPFTFTDSRSDGKVLAIGMEGSVFALGKDQLLYRWSNAQQAFKAFPGYLVKLAVDPGGNPWGINQFGRVFRHDSTDWRQVPGLASDIAIGASGRVIIANDSGELSEYVNDAQGFSSLPAYGADFVAVGKDGTPWGLLKDGTVVRCRQAPCDRLPKKAIHLAVGPDDSVFIVNPEGRLQRYQPDSDDWQTISVNGRKVAKVAVGPKGRPWVVTEDGSILYSALFPRDESTDTETSNTTKKPTTGTGDTAPVNETGSFVITKNLLFGSVSSSLPVLTGVTVGQDGTVLGLGYADDVMSVPAFERYDTTQKKMLRQNVELPNGDLFKTVKADADGSLWFQSLGTNGRLYHKKGSTITTVDVFPGTAFCAVGACPIESSLFDLEVGPDGSLYVIVADGSLYVRSPTATKFSKFVAGSYRRVAVSRGGDVWVMTTFGNELRQIVNGVVTVRALRAGEFPLDLAGAANGNVYVVYTDGTSSKLARWNVTSQSFDKVNRTASAVGLTPNGRPWVVDDLNNPGVLFFAK